MDQGEGCCYGSYWNLNQQKNNIFFVTWLVKKQTNCNTVATFLQNWDHNSIIHESHHCLLQKKTRKTKTWSKLDALQCQPTFQISGTELLAFGATCGAVATWRIAAQNLYSDCSWLEHIPSLKPTWHPKITKQMYWQYTLSELFPNKVSQTIVPVPVGFNWPFKQKHLHLPSPSTPKWQWREDSDCRRRSQWHPQLWPLHCGPPRQHSTQIFDHLDILMAKARV